MLRAVDLEITSECIALKQSGGGGCNLGPVASNAVHSLRFDKLDDRRVSSHAAGAGD